MNNLFKINFDRKSEIPMYQQLGDSIYEFIENGALLPDSKLPPIRKLSQKLNINNITVINAYKYLENKKIVYSKVGSGTYVSELKINDIPEPILNQSKNVEAYNKYQLKNAINFANTSVSADLFPVNKFKELFNEVLDRDKGNAFSYQDSQGYEPLRYALCETLEYNGIKTSADKIQIISGAQQGIDIISKVMLSSGDIVFVENPTYYGAIGAILSRGAGIVEIPVLKDGIDIDKLKSLLKVYQPKFIYVMTYYQTPTCISYSIEKKRQLLEIANKYNIYIVEEDNLSDFNYTDKPIVTLKALDYKNKVIYIKSFSKILMPGLRLGFMVLPKAISKNVLSAKYATDISTSSFIQRAFELYLKSNDWNNHIKLMKSIFKYKYNITLSAIDEYLKGNVSFTAPNGGLSFWLELLNKNISLTKLCNILLNKNVILTPGSVFLTNNNEDTSYIRINFSHVENKDILKGIEVIGKVLIDYDNMI